MSRQSRYATKATGLRALGSCAVCVRQIGIKTRSKLCVNVWGGWGPGVGREWLGLGGAGRPATATLRSGRRQMVAAPQAVLL